MSVEPFKHFIKGFVLNGLAQLTALALFKVEEAEL